MSKRLKSVAAVACMKTFLMLLNFVFWIVGLMMLYAGIWLRIHDYIDVSLEGSGAALLILAGFGSILILASTLACCCTTWGHPALLYLYGAYLAVVAVLEVGAVASICAYRSTLNDSFEQSLNSSISVYGQDPIRTYHVDTLQSTLQCCGNKGYTDWLTMYSQKEIPLSCCSVPQEACDTTETDHIFTEGCYTRVKIFIISTAGLLSWMAWAAVGLLVVGVFLACCLATSINKAKYEQVA